MSKKHAERINWGIGEYRKRLRQAQHKLAKHTKEVDEADDRLAKFTVEICGNAACALNGDMYTEMIQWAKRDGRLAELAQLWEETLKLSMLTEQYQLEGQRHGYELFPCGVVHAALKLISGMGNAEDSPTQFVAELARATFVRLHNEAVAKGLAEVKAMLAAESN